MRYLLALCDSTLGKKEIEAFEVESDTPIRNMQDAEQLKLKIDSWETFGGINKHAAKVIAFSRFED